MQNKQKYTNHVFLIIMDFNKSYLIFTDFIRCIYFEVLFFVRHPAVPNAWMLDEVS